MSALETQVTSTDVPKCQAVVFWIDWYAYHLARFKGLQSAFGTNGEVSGIELVGGAGVHAGYAFREGRSEDLPIETLLPGKSWHQASQIKLSFSLIRRLSALDPELVMVPGYYTLPAVAGALWCKVKGRVSILMTESTAGDHPRKGWRETLKSNLIRSLFDWAVTGGVAHDRYLLQLGFPKDRIVHFYDVVGNSQITGAAESFREQASPAEHGLPECYFLFVGRLSPEKNVEGLLRAWQSYRDTGGTWSLVLAGDGPDKSALQQISASGPDAAQVTFLGHLGSRELLPAYAFAKAFVLPSTREPWGLVVNEAMAAALPVLVSNRCGCAEDLVRHGENGFVFDPSNDGELAHLLGVVASMSRADLQQQGLKSLQRIGNFSPQNLGRQIVSIAETVERLKKRPPTSSSRSTKLDAKLKEAFGGDPMQRQPDGAWLQVLSHIDPKYGGLSAMVPQLARRLVQQEHISTNIAAFCHPHEAAGGALEDGNLSYWPTDRSQWMFDTKVREEFFSTVASAKGLHIHGLWESSTLFAAAAARRASIPYVLSAHGMLERWAMANKRMKKLIYSTLIEERNVRGAACLHALTASEAEDYRRFGCKGPIAIIPNGVDAPTTADPSLFRMKYPQASGKRLVLFLGRIHFKKGIDLLLQAWSQLASEFPDTLLVLAGPDSENTLASATQTVGQLRIHDRVLFTGMLDPTLKWSALAASDYFVLPSYSEGLSVAALEALSMGLPLILSEQCNLPQIDKAGAGWLVKTDVENLARVLRVALETSTEKRHAMSVCARSLARSEFDWVGVTAKMAQLYRWISGGPAPHDVQILRSVA